MNVRLIRAGRGSLRVTSQLSHGRCIFTCKNRRRYSRERALSSLPALRVQIPQVLCKFYLFNSYLLYLDILLVKCNTFFFVFSGVIRPMRVNKSYLYTL